MIWVVLWARIRDTIAQSGLFSQIIGIQFSTVLPVDKHILLLLMGKLWRDWTMEVWWETQGVVMSWKGCAQPFSIEWGRYLENIVMTSWLYLPEEVIWACWVGVRSGNDAFTLWPLLERFNSQLKLPKKIVSGLIAFLIFKFCLEEALVIMPSDYLVVLLLFIFPKGKLPLRG